VVEVNKMKGLIRKMRERLKLLKGEEARVYGLALADVKLSHLFGCERCGATAPTTICPECVTEINNMELWTQRTEQVRWGLAVMLRHGAVECDAQHDEFSAVPKARLPDADQKLLVDGLNWHCDEEEAWYGFFT
jgi:hypothetical protein